MMALCSAGIVRPVEGRDAPVEALNRALQARLDGAEPIDALALGCGTALRLNAARLRAIRDSEIGGDPTSAAWGRYAAHHCGSCRSAILSPARF
jgi:hypothetical protein